MVKLLSEFWRYYDNRLLFTTNYQTMSYIIPFAFIATLFFMFSLFIGEFFLNKFSKFSSNDITNLPHFSSSLGVVLSVSIFSLFYSSFQTVNMLAILLIFVFFIKKISYSSRKINNKRILTNSVIFSGLFIVVSFFHLVLTKDNLDIFFYGGMASNGLYETGVENFYGYYNEYLPADIANRTMPYHYFELWMVVLFKQFPMGYSFAMVLKYLVYPFLETLIIYSFYFILKSRKLKVNLFTFIPVLLATLFPLTLVLGFFNTTWAAFNFDFWSYPNFILYSFILVNALTFFAKNDFKNGLFILLFLPIISITTAPAILTTVFVVSLCFYLTKVFNLKEAGFLLLSSSLLAIGILLFYKVTGGSIDSIAPSSEHWVLKYKNAWKAIVYILGVINSIIVLFLLLLSYFNKKVKILNSTVVNKILFICFVSVSSGVFIYQLAFYIENTYQFVYVGYSLVFNLFILILLTGLYSLSKIKCLSYVLLIISFSTFLVKISKVSFKDVRISEFNYFEDKEIVSTESELNLILNKKGKVIVVLSKDNLPYIRSFSYRVPMSGLFFLGDYKIITMVDENILYTPVKGRQYDIGYDRAKIANSILPKEWFNLNNIDSIAAREKVMFIAIPKGDSEVRSMVNLPVKDSLVMSNYQLLFLE